jgi:hypothetical protein
MGRWGDGEMGRWGDGEMGRETGFLRVLCLGTRNILINSVSETIDEGEKAGFYEFLIGCISYLKIYL